MTMGNDNSSNEINTGTELQEMHTPLPKNKNERQITDKKPLQDDRKENSAVENRERQKNRKKFEDKDLPNERFQYVYFWKRSSYLSQQFPSKFVVDKITYTSAEQYMMHQKAVLMGDKESADIIKALDEPSEIKKIGRHVKNFNQELWEISCQDVVEKGNMAKFSQNEDLKDLLFSTYPKTLVEASPIDRIWGIGLSKDDQRAWNKETWRGHNLLGEILTKVRNTLMGSFLEPVVPVKADEDIVHQGENELN